MRRRDFLVASLAAVAPVVVPLRSCFAGKPAHASGAAAVHPSGMLEDLDEKKLAAIFKEYDAAFVLVDMQNNKHYRLNAERCARRFSPFSTYKIFNSLVGLETGVVTDENFGMKWDGTKYELADWNRDQTLQSSITNSVVWYFQRLAAAVGEDRMKEYITKASYGNEDISAGITKFWLGTSLQISADEQTGILKQLLCDELPFSKRSMGIVRGMLRLKETDKGTLYGKTGSDGKSGKLTFGWFVGYLVQPERKYVFATNISASDHAWGRRARQLTEQVLETSGLL